MAHKVDIPVEAAPDDCGGDETGPVRACAETRVRRPKAELVRFATGPDGSVVPDLAERLPGRGVWLTCDRQVVAAAVCSRAFSRSLKRKVAVDADLPARVETLMFKRVLNALSLANKAGLVTTGFTRVDAAVAADTVLALLHAVDGSDEGTEKLDRRFRAVCRDGGRTAIVVKLLTIEQLSLALGRSNVVHAALGAGGAAEKLLSELERLQRYRTGGQGRQAEHASAGGDVAPASD